jgi:UDP-N-acetylmuramoyl-L-alanyl-D-glutamate--2,6-diaminopimelate ligase
MSLVRDCEAKPLTYSVRKQADLSAKLIDQSGGMSTLMVTHLNTTAMMETAICGAANAGNHLAAALVGLLLGHRIEEVVEKLSQLREVPGRGQRLIEYGQATVVIDAAGSTQRAAATLRTQRSMKAAGRMWCVLAISDRESPESLAQYGTLMERFADHAIVTAQSNSKKSFIAASHSVLDGVQDCAAMRLVADQRGAIEWAISKAQPADTILIMTGQKMESAHEERHAVDQIKNWVDQLRQPADESSEPIKLKIFN